MIELMFFDNYSKDKKNIFLCILFNILGGIVGSTILYFFTNEGGLILAVIACCIICSFANTTLNYGCWLVWSFDLIYTFYLFVSNNSFSDFETSDLLLYILGQIYSFFICFIAYKWSHLHS